MKIAAIEVYQADLPLVDGSYAWADGKVVSEYDSTVGGREIISLVGGDSDN